MVTIRAEMPSDAPVVHALNVEAFTSSELGYSGEAELVDAVRAGHALDIVSLVAEQGGQVVGHILFSPATIGDHVGMGLGPMAVAPGHQGHGIGSRLVEHGLAQLRTRGCPFVVVLGHPKYYPRFGFETASTHGVRCEYDGVPDEAFMLLVLDEAIDGLRGVAHYLPEFGAVS